MKLAPLAVAALILGGAAPAIASQCTSSFSLGTLAPSGVAGFGNTFSTPQLFNDCYSFAISGAANAFGVTISWDWSPSLNIDLSSATLWGGNLANPVVDLTPGSFSFNGLASGQYQLALAGNVAAAPYRTPGFDVGVGYAGLLTTSAPTIVTPVPEPETLAMLALGLFAIVATTRRKG